jgi:hypothetical protein
MSSVAVKKYYSAVPGSDLRVQLDCGTTLHAERSRLVAASAFFSSMFKWNFQVRKLFTTALYVTFAKLQIFILPWKKIMACENSKFDR